MIETRHSAGGQPPLPPGERSGDASRRPGEGVFAAKPMPATRSLARQMRKLPMYRKQRSRMLFLPVLGLLAVLSASIPSVAGERKFADLAVAETAIAWMEDLCDFPMKGSAATTPVLKSNSKIRSGPPRNTPYAIVYGAKDGAYLMIHPPVGSTNPTDVIFAHSTFTSAPKKACSKRDAPLPTLFGMKGHSKFNRNVSIKEAWQHGQ